METVVRWGRWRCVARWDAGRPTLGVTLAALARASGVELAALERAAADLAAAGEVLGGDAAWLPLGAALEVLAVVGGVAGARAVRELDAARGAAVEALDAWRAGLVASTAPAAPRGALAAEEAAERDRIVAALAEAKGSKVAAARSLGMARRTLYRRLIALGLES